MAQRRTSAKTIVVATVLAMALAGCAAMLAGGPAHRAAAPPKAHGPAGMAGSRATGPDQTREGRVLASLRTLPLYFSLDSFELLSSQLLRPHDARVWGRVLAGEEEV